jgi:hypothetical protein
MGKINVKTKISLVLVIVLTISMVSTVVPIAMATLPGDYEEFGPDSGNSKVRAHWEGVTSPGFDVFIFTATQYALWLINPTQDPTSYVGASFSVTGNGELTRTLNPGSTYYVVYSNANGGSDVSYSSIGAAWSAGVPGFEFILVFIGLLVLIGIVFYLREKPLRAIRRSLTI